MTNTDRSNSNAQTSLLAKSNAGNGNDVILWADPATHALLISGSISVSGLAGNKSNNAAAPTSDNLGALTAVASAAAQSYVEGNQVLLSTDLAGALRVTGSLSVGGTTDNSAFTAGTSTGTPAMGFYHSTIDTVTDGRAASVAITSKRAMHSNLRDSSGNEVAIGQAIPASTAYGLTVREAGTGVASSNNSSTATLLSGVAFTGTSDAVLDYASATIYVFADQASATNGLSIQQSNDGTNWDVVDTYTVPAMSAGQGKTYGVQVTGSFLRVVYTNGGTNQGAFRLQTLFHKFMQNSSSVRPADGRSVENDMQEVVAYNAVYDGVSAFNLKRQGVNAANTTGTGFQGVINLAQFDDVAPTSITENQFGNQRMSANRNLYVTLRDAAGNERGLNIDASGQITVVNAAGSAVIGHVIVDSGTITTVTTVTTVSAVTAVGTITPGTAATSLGKAEDAVHASGDVGVFALSVGNEAQATFAADGDYIAHAVDTKGNSLTVGNLAHDAVDAGFPVKVGGQARTTNPTAVSDADRSNFITDKLGKQVVVGSIRDLKGDAALTITSSTTETSLIAAVASTFIDVYGLIVTNISATACEVIFRDVTAGTARFSIYVPAGDTRGFMLPESAAYKQATVNTAWTAQCVTSVASIKINALYVKNI